MNIVYKVDVLNATHDGNTQMVGIATTYERAMFLAASVSIIEENQKPEEDLDGGMIYTFRDEENDVVQVKITSIRVNKCLINY
jgi:hypothetical protein